MDEIAARELILLHQDLIGKVIEIIPKMGILLVGPVRFSLIAVIGITAIFLLKESFESKSKSNSS